MNEPLAVYGRWLRNEAEGQGAVTRIRLRDGGCRPAPTARWIAPADAVDERALAHLAGPVLDVGCGPGRHLHALARRGIFGLGVDLSPVAVGMVRGGGARAIVASVFDDLPDAGGWQSALLLDGNIGIGGNPARLLARVAELLAPGGQLVVELAPPGVRSGRTSVRLERGEEVSAWFAWADVAAPDIDDPAAAAGLSIVTRWEDEGRWFARLACPHP